MINIPFLSKWLQRREIRVFVSDFLLKQQAYEKRRICVIYAREMSRLKRSGK